MTYRHRFLFQYNGRLWASLLPERMCSGRDISCVSFLFSLFLPSAVLNMWPPCFFLKENDHKRDLLKQHRTLFHLCLSFIKEHYIENNLKTLESFCSVLLCFETEAQSRANTWVVHSILRTRVQQEGLNVYLWGQLRARAVTFNVSGIS